MFLPKLEESFPESSPDWDIIADYHLQLANFYDGLGDVQGTTIHRAQHLPILKRIAEKHPYRPTGVVSPCRQCILEAICPETAQIFCGAS